MSRRAEDATRAGTAIRTRRIVPVVARDRRRLARVAAARVRLKAITALRLRQHTGIDFDPHWLRHSAATRMLRDGVPFELVSVLGQASVTTTLQIYGHLTAQDARRVLEQAGWFTDSQVRL